MFRPIPLHELFEQQKCLDCEPPTTEWIRYSLFRFTCFWLSKVLSQWIWLRPFRFDCNFRYQCKNLNNSSSTLCRCKDKANRLSVNWSAYQLNSLLSSLGPIKNCQSFYFYECDDQKYLLAAQPHRSSRPVYLLMWIQMKYELFYCFIWLNVQMVAEWIFAPDGRKRDRADNGQTFSFLTICSPTTNGRTKIFYSVLLLTISSQLMWRQTDG